MKSVTSYICASFPRYLTFDRFVLDSDLIRGRVLNADIDTNRLKKALTDHGFTPRNTWSDVSRGDKSGFIAIKSHPSLKNRTVAELPAAAKFVLQKPLRASVYVEGFYLFTQSSNGSYSFYNRAPCRASARVS
ncbi:hypothetical protein PMAYCL1PPCAC_10352 [Pristionchus mayeri]|uniref:Uncharacterized protein n=1 Tax=Pristionchus mayeri TaxID=1317129 RepID=A0AAN5CE17_9BILA|nr:hypothetical protein PMAYCL1PPCAC_10352 [Pristionchus mayeri]